MSPSKRRIKQDTRAHKPQSAEQPFSTRELKLMKLLYSLPPAESLNGGQLSAMIKVSPSDLTTRIIGSKKNGLGLRGRGWDIPNRRPRVGYSLSEADRERFKRMISRPGEQGGKGGTSALRRMLEGDVFGPG
jgi:hypothetical protein